MAHLSRAQRITAAGVATMALGACGAPDAPSSTAGAAYTNLYEALGRPAHLAVQGDSAVVVTEIVTKQMRDMNRQVAARMAAGVVAHNWPAARLRRVTVVFREPTRLGPFVIRTRDDSVTVSDATPQDSGAAPARLP